MSESVGIIYVDWSLNDLFMPCLGVDVRSVIKSVPKRVREYIYDTMMTYIISLLHMFLLPCSESELHTLRTSLSTASTAIITNESVRLSLYKDVGDRYIEPDDDPTPPLLNGMVVNKVDVAMVPQTVIDACNSMRNELQRYIRLGDPNLQSIDCKYFVDRAHVSSAEFY